MRLRDDLLEAGRIVAIRWGVAGLGPRPQGLVLGLLPAPTLQGRLEEDLVRPCHVVAVLVKVLLPLVPRGISTLSLIFFGKSGSTSLSSCRIM